MRRRTRSICGPTHGERIAGAILVHRVLGSAAGQVAPREHVFGECYTVRVGAVVARVLSGTHVDDVIVGAELCLGQGVGFRTTGGAKGVAIEAAALAGQAKQLGMKVHMDGARFANALVHLDCTPAEMTWKAGVDMVSFGGTKNGCWCAEALVLFDPSQREEAEYLRKRAGQLFSKSRFVSLQFEAYLEDGLWLDLARHANAMADKLRQGITASKHARLAWPSQANEVFPVMNKSIAEKLQGEGAFFYPWATPHWMENPPGDDEAVYRLVTSFANGAEEIDRFVALLDA